MSSGEVELNRKKIMLNDSVVHYFQVMIKEKLQLQNDFQDPVLGQKFKFKSFVHVPFVQVLHDANFHWFAISTYECAPGEINYFDSFFNGRISDFSKRQIFHAKKRH